MGGPSYHIIENETDASHTGSKTKVKMNAGREKQYPEHMDVQSSPDSENAPKRSDLSGSVDIRDPLNWSKAKKLTNFAVLCYATFAGLSTATANSLALVAQAETWHISPTRASYTISANIGGIILGSLLLVPMVKVIGVTGCCFWSHVIATGISIWSAESSGPNDYNSFIASRAIVGIFEPTAQILTNGVIVNMFPLHQRGRAFAIHATCYTLATVAGPTFCGFIVQHQNWPVALWWTVASNALAALLILLFVDDTAWDRDRQMPVSRRPIPTSWISRRVATVFPGNKVAPPFRAGDALKSLVAPFQIILSPATLIAGLYSMVNFSWFVVSTIELPISLEEPYAPAKGLSGYGFTAQQSGAFFFASWFGAIAAVTYGSVLNDRLPLRLSRRNGGAWHPEYRLHTAWFPGLVAAPIGCALYGAALQYHLHFMVYALGLFFITFAGIASVPVSINYVIESFKQYPQEVGACLNAYRLGFGLAIPFFYNAWEAKVGINWLWGMAAFFSIFAFMLVVVLMWQGPYLRSWTVLKDSTSEDEAKT